MELSTAGQRVLGSLVEKQLATPNQYPLSLNSLQAACNQLTGRDPVVDYDEQDVRGGLDDLKANQLVKAEYARGSRTPKYAHRLGEQLDLDEAQIAVLALLLLRGPQTPGELRARSERLHRFTTLEEVDETLEGLASHRFGALAEPMPRQPGQKEVRWRHLLGHARDLTAQVGTVTASAATDTPPPSDAPDIESELAALRAEVARLREDVDELRRRLD